MVVEKINDSSVIRRRWRLLAVRCRGWIGLDICWARSKSLGQYSNDGENQKQCGASGVVRGRSSCWRVKSVPDQSVVSASTKACAAKGVGGRDRSSRSGSAGVLGQALQLRGRACDSSNGQSKWLR